MPQALTGFVADALVRGLLDRALSTPATSVSKPSLPVLMH